MSGAKIRLSSIEMELVQNSSWILTKRSIIDKVYAMFGSLSEKYVTIVDKTDLPSSIKSTPPKISKGENYHGLPYVVLDYPRVFGKENTFAIRTLFWWGNYFSSTFQLKGVYKNELLNFLSGQYEQLADAGYFIAVGEDEWDFRFDENNYKTIHTLKNDEWNNVLHTQSFIKLSVKIPLMKWEEATGELLRYFQLHLHNAGINCPNDETNLLPGNPITGSDL